MGIYLKSGYLNLPYIEKLADSNNCFYILCIGGRQVGKTYGTLQMMLNENKRFILMRRTQTESDFISNGTINPFIPIDKNVSIKKASQYHSEIFRDQGDEKEKIGIALALSSVAKIRGFDGSLYTDLIFDEFIPERHIQKIKNEGDAFLNAIVTISGNRELEDKKPLRVWLLANSNNLAAPILQALNITDKIEEMKRKEQELSILPERSTIIVLPKSDEILKQRQKKSTLLKAIRGESSFTKMAFKNEFSYNDTTGVKQNVNLGEYRYLTTAAGMDIFLHKSNRVCYVCSATHKDDYQNNATGKKRFLKYCPQIKPLYFSEKMLFSNLTVKEEMKAFLDVD